MQDFFFQNQGNLLKRDLFARNQQMESLSKELEKIMLLPKKQRERWAQENEDFLTRILDTFSDDSVLALNAVELDAQSMELSVEFVSRLRTIMTILKNIMGKARRLKS